MPPGMCWAWPNIVTMLDDYNCPDLTSPALLLTVIHPFIGHLVVPALVNWFYLYLRTTHTHVSPLLTIQGASSLTILLWLDSSISMFNNLSRFQSQGSILNTKTKCKLLPSPPPRPCSLAWPWLSLVTRVMKVSKSPDVTTQHQWQGAPAQTQGVRTWLASPEYITDMKSFTWKLAECLNIWRNKGIYSSKSYLVWSSGTA